MGVDEVLLRRAAETGDVVFRVYAWSVPTLSLGRNQPAHGEYDPAALHDHGVSVVRRLTGGRAVLHHREVTYSVTAPASLGMALRDAYVRINEILVDGLRALGAHASMASPSGRAPLPSTAPCFEEPTEGELVLGARKLVGSAQYREGGALLQHGSILVDDDQPLVRSLVRSLPRSLRSQTAPPLPPATLHDALGRVPALDEVASALFDAVRAREDRDATALVADHAFTDAVALAAERYRDEAWTWRR